MRGFALFGVLIVNWSSLPGSLLPGADLVVDTGLDLLVFDSFYPQFSFLFGLGFAVQLMRAQDRGAGVTHLYLRRLSVLFLFGAAHFILLWNGDIGAYALTGFLLIPLARLPMRALFGVLVVLLVIQVAPPPFLESPPSADRTARDEATGLVVAGRTVQLAILDGR